MQFIYYVIIVYVIGFFAFFSRNAICTCGEHFSFLGFLQSFVWFIIYPYRAFKYIIFDYKYLSSHKHKGKGK